MDRSNTSRELSNQANNQQQQLSQSFNMNSSNNFVKIHNNNNNINNNNNNCNQWNDVPAIVVNDCGQRLALPQQYSQYPINVIHNNSDDDNGAVYRPTTCSITIDPVNSIQSISNNNLINADRRRSSNISAVSRVLELQNEEDKYRHLIRDILRSDSLISAQSSVASTCSARTSLPPVADTEICPEIDEYQDEHDEAELVMSSQANAETNTSQSLLQLTMAQHDSTSRGRDSVGTNSSISNKSTKRSRNFWDKICDYSHRITRYINIVDICAILVAFLLSLLVLLWLGTITSKTVLIFALVWFGLCLFYYWLPILKSWFYYWDPDISFLKPT